MKRLNILIPGTLVCALILACTLAVRRTSQLSFADEKQSAKPGEWEHVAFTSGVGKGEDVLVLRLWKSAAADPNWPQLALLRLPPAVYKKFREDTNVFKAFIDGTQTRKPVFNASVTITDGCKLPEPEDEQSDGVSWLVIINHRQSHSICTAFLEQAGQ